MSYPSVGGRPRTPYTRWERSFDGNDVIVGALQDDLLNFGVTSLCSKPPETATVSIVSAPQFKMAKRDYGVDFDINTFAARFLQNASRSPLKPLPATIKGVDLIPGRNEGECKAAIILDCPRAHQEINIANKFLGQKPFLPDIHISLMHFKEPSTDSARKAMTNRLSALVAGTTLILEPVTQKYVAADSATTMTSLRSLERQYYLARVKRFVCSGFGRHIAATNLKT